MQREHAQVTNMTGFRKDKNNHADFLMHAQYSGHSAVVFIVLRHLPDMTNQMESERDAPTPAPTPDPVKPPTPSPEIPPPEPPNPTPQRPPMTDPEPHPPPVGDPDNSPPMPQQCPYNALAIVR